MSRKSVLIVDDEDHGRHLVKQYLESYPDFFIAGECSNGIEAIKYINMMEPDLVFLDIQMPGANGFEVLHQIAHVPHVIFTTAFDKYAIRAFELNAVDYLLKPYTKERFDNTMRRLQTNHAPLAKLALNTLSSPLHYLDRIIVEHQKRFKSVSIEDIMYLKADGDYTQIYTPETSFLSSLGISAVSQRFDPKRFVRIHRSVVVNLTYVSELYRDIGKTFLVLADGTEFNIGRSYLPEIKNLMI